MLHISNYKTTQFNTSGLLMLRMAEVGRLGNFLQTTAIQIKMGEFHFFFLFSSKYAFNTNNMLNYLSDLTWPNCHVLFYALHFLSTWQATDTCLGWVTEDKIKSMREWNMRQQLDNQSCFKWYRTTCTLKPNFF